MFKKSFINRVLIIKNRPNPNWGERVVLSLYNFYRKLKYFVRHQDNKEFSKSYLFLKDKVRNITGKDYTFVSMEELVSWVEDWVKIFPDRYDLVVGVPRSGLMVASLIACKLGLPLTTPDNSLNQIWSSRLMSKQDNFKHVLLVDDSVSSGRSITEGLSALKSILGQNIKISTAALIVSPESLNKVDLFYKIIPKPRLFEWNMLHSNKQMIIASDLDGVLCPEPPPGIDLDPQNYNNWIRNVNPYMIPNFELEAVVTNRLSDYRDETEIWLKKNGVKYKHLMMWEENNLGPKKQSDISRHKVSALLKVKPDIYWESQFKEGEKINQQTKIPTLCLDQKIILS